MTTFPRTISLNSKNAIKYPIILSQSFTPFMKAVFTNFPRSDTVPHRWCAEKLDLNTESKVHEANMGPTWVPSAPGGPHVDPIKLSIRVTWSNSWNLIRYSQQISARAFYGTYSCPNRSWTILVRGVLVSYHKFGWASGRVGAWGPCKWDSCVMVCPSVSSSSSRHGCRGVFSISDKKS